ncbi:MAG: tRNA/rRNA methyltransferase (SpoU) [Acidobacteriaceae bacterium]|nr:tRNA/rRNA methyltransferase (SpoU) [Acidobacteriaceae bacterium]
MICRQEPTLEKTRSADPRHLRRIEGRHNSLLKELRQAFSRGELTTSGECAIEGFRVIEEAVRSGLRFRAVFVSESGQARAARLLPQIGSHVETVLVPDKLFASAVPSESPQGLAALVNVKSHALNEVLESAVPGPFLVIAGLQDPGNLGTILRSAEAFGAKAVLLSEGTVSVYNSKVVRASAGSVFRLAVVKVELKTVIETMRTRGVRLFATSSHKGTLLPEADLRGQVAIFIGNEGAGLEKKLLSEMDELIMIPHSQRVESLNAGIAASIMLYEASRQKS